MRSSARSTITRKRPSSSTTTTSISRRAFVRAARPDARARALRAHPLADATGRCCPSRWRAVHDGLARERRRRLPHRALGAELPCAAVQDDRRRDPRTYVTHHPISIDVGRVRRVWQASDAVLARGANARRRGRRSSSCASTAPIRRRTSCVAFTRSALLLERASRVAGARHHARAARPLSPGDSGVRRLRRRDRARGARRQRRGSAAGWQLSTCRSPTTSRNRSPRTSSTTCCSSTRSRTG